MLFKILQFTGVLGFWGFTNSLGFMKFFPLATESEGKRNMVDFVQLVGIPPAIHSDDAKVFQHGFFKKTS